MLVENLYGLANEAIHPFNYFLVHFSIFRTIGSFLKIENAISIWTFEIWKLNCERLITLHNFFTKVFYVKLTSLFSHAQFFRNYEINNAKKAKKHGQEMTLSDEF